MNSVIEYLNKLGHTTIDESYYSYINNWEDWYKGKVDDFHKSTFFNGITNVELDVKSVGMAKTVCEVWAGLLLNEKVELTTASNESDEVLKEVLDDNLFHINGNQLIERAFALGTGAFIEYIQDNKVKIDYITADMIFPISWSNRGITECAFGSRIHNSYGDCVLLQLHLLNENGTYRIENHLALVGENEYKELPLPNDIPDVVNSNSEKPFFQIIKPNIVNNIDSNVPLGISVFANAIDCLKEIDTTFDALNTEIETGRRMVFLASSLFFTDEAGNMKNVIGNREKVMRFVGETGDDANKLIHDFSPNIRSGELTNTLQTQLNLFSKKVGMGVNGFDFSNRNITTATQVMSENNEMFRNLKKHENLLRIALCDLVEALAYLGDEVQVPINATEVSVNFDDSIIEDTNAIKSQALTEFNAGLIDAVQYYIDVYKLTEEQAIKFQQELESRKPEEPEEDEGNELDEE